GAARVLLPAAVADTNATMNDGLQGAWRWVAILGGAVMTGAICAAAVPLLQARDGAAATGVLAAERPLLAAAALIGCFLVSAAIAAGVGRLTNAAVGMFVLGCGIMAPALRSGTITELALGDIGATKPLVLMGIETIIWAALILIAGFIVLTASGPLPELDATDDDGRPVRWWSADAITGALAALIVPLAVWLLCRSPLNGQAFMSVVVGAMAAGLIARLVKPHAKPLLLFAASCLAGGIVQLVAATKLNGPVDVAYVKLLISNLSKPMPLDYAAGSLIGVSMGLGWARSFIHVPETAPAGMK
ncbi:MAG: hypothetical protein L0Y44_05670, partial [Phycisphaerales bacterium]|nr:hypothetical protein [Phycisphaerales bacterium]